MVQALFDTSGLTGLVNSTAGNFIAPTESLSPRGFDAVANIVFHGTFYVTQAVGKRCRSRRDPHQSNALATGGDFHALRDWSQAERQAARERIEAQDAKDGAQR